MIRTELLGTAHNPNIDNMTVSQMRVVLEHLLYTMGINQRNDLKETFPGLYRMIYPDSITKGRVYLLEGTSKDHNNNEKD